MQSIDFSVPNHTDPDPLSASERAALEDRIRHWLKVRDAVLVAHYYTDPMLQALAESTGGVVSDSLEMARFGHQHQASTLAVIGVRFMGETAKILSPEKTVIMPTLEATCSLDLGCPAEALAAFKAQYPDRTVVVYANTSAAVKAQADWVVTSSIALDVVRHLKSQNKPILWAPDKYLGSYIQKETDADMVLWDGACVVHEEFKAEGIRALKAQHPDSDVLVHPESPAQVIAMADVVGSTSQLIKAAKASQKHHLIVATDRGIFYKMKQAAPDKQLWIAPTGGAGATCRSCAHCPWMAMNGLANLESALATMNNRIELDPALIQKARVPLDRMLSFKVNG